MNIAFPALIVLLLLLPGVLLSYWYRRGFFQRSPVTLNPIRDEVGRGIVLAIFVHPAALSVLWCFGSTLDTQALLSLLLKRTPLSNETVSEGLLLHWFVYLVGVNAAAIGVGIFLHSVVRGLHLDLRYDRLRFSNEWHYLFSGEARVFTADQSERDFASIRQFIDSDDIDFIFVSVVIEQGGGPILYWGDLTDFFFDTNGALESIVLQSAQRRRFNSDEDRQEGGAATPVDDERFYPIRGDYLVIRYADVKTLNLEYLRIAASDDEDEGDNNSQG